MRFHNRRDWGARAPRNRSSIGPGVYGVTVHWNGPGLGNYAHSRCDDLVRGMQRYHMDTNGWADIGYNAAVCRHGHVWEGRGLGVQGAHAGTSSIGGNSHWYGLQAMVGVGDDLTSDLFDGLRDAIGWFRNHGAGHRVNGHRDHHATECPGDELYRWTRGDIEEDDVLNHDDKKWLEDHLGPRRMWGWDGIDSGHPKNPEWAPQTFLRNLEADGDTTQALVRKLLERDGVDVDELLLADELAPKLAPRLLSVLSPEQIADAIGDDLAERLANVLAARLTREESRS